MALLQKMHQAGVDPKHNVIEVRRGFEALANLLVGILVALF